jgi:hypothetical protein
MPTLPRCRERVRVTLLLEAGVVAEGMLSARLWLRYVEWKTSPFTVAAVPTALRTQTSL